MKTRRLWVQIAAAVCAAALVLMMVLAMPVPGANADQREDAVKRRDESQAKVDSLKDEVLGIDRELAELFKQAEQTKIDVANAQIALADAEAELAAAQRHLSSVRAELDEAESELQSLTETVGVSKENEQYLTQAVGGMARELYRGTSTSPMQVVMSSEGTAEISSRAAAASALGRVQSKALDEVRSSLVVQRNQQERQTAVTERIGLLEVEAEAALEVSEAAKAAVEGKLNELETLQKSQVQAEKDWLARKGDAEKQIQEFDAALVAASADIARIDRENAENDLVIESRPPTGGSSSALFGYPFSYQVPITSTFGWRIHPIFNIPRLHDGTDFGPGCGVPQLATRAGVVSYAGWIDGLGNQVTINHGLVNGSSMVTQFGHMERVAVSSGQSVQPGQVIGFTGTTGNSTGCHLHLSLYVDGTPVNILDYM